MVSCRNLLIYLGPELQKKIIPLFHYALKPNGYLLLGNSETIGDCHDLCSPINKKWKIYIKKVTTTFQQNFSTFTLPLIAKLKTDSKSMALPKNSKTELRKLLEQTLLEEYTPPCVIINPDFEILYIQGSTGRYLEPAKGEASLNLSKMIRAGMKMELQAAVRKVITSNSAVRYDGLKVENNGNPIRVNLIVQPIRDNNYHKGKTTE
jgi:two-component system CheB/CheR fusion protein